MPLFYSNSRFWLITLDSNLILGYTNSRLNIRNAAIDTTLVNTTTQIQSPILEWVAFPSRNTNSISPRTHPTVGIIETKDTIIAIVRRDLKSATTNDILDAMYIQHAVTSASITNAKASIPTYYPHSFQSNQIVH